MVHKPPVKKQLSPYRCREITYVSKVQQAPEEDSSLALDKKGVLQVQLIVGALMYCAISLDNKLLASLSAIGSYQDSATEKPFKAINQLLDYCATYPDDGIVYRSSDIILTLMQDSIMKQKQEAEQGAISFYLKMNPLPVGMGQF